MIAHAAVRAEAGDDVAILIQRAQRHSNGPQRGARIRKLARAGRLRVWDTQTILLRAVGGAHLPDQATMKAVYATMQSLDDALPPISATNLLSTEVWKKIDEDRAD